LLLDTQTALARFLLSGDEAAVAGLAVDDRIPARKRLMVHRSNVMGSLVTVLAELYPAVERLAGGARFRAAGARYVALHPPREPRLSAYGGGFPAFLAEAAEFAPLPCAADLARLEWARHACALAADPPPVELAALQAVPAEDVPGLRLSLHPAVALLSLEYCVSPLWLQLTRQGPDTGAVPAQPERLLLRRHDDGVAQRTLSAAELGFLLAFDGGSTLAAAARSAMALDPFFDLTACLANHLLAGTFACFTAAPNPSDLR